MCLCAGAFAASPLLPLLLQEETTHANGKRSALTCIPSAANDMTLATVNEIAAGISSVVTPARATAFREELKQIIISLSTEYLKAN